jgi:hypothetical protein
MPATFMKSAESRPSAEMTPGLGGHENVAHAKFVGDFGRQQRPGAPERQQRVVARVAAALGGDELHGAHDVGDGEPDGGGRCAGDVGAEAGGDGSEGGVRAIGVEPHGVAEEGVGANGAAHDMGVGDRGLGAAAAIAGRPGHGADAARTDAQHAAVVDPDQAAAARADRNDVEHRGADRQAVDLGFRRHRRLTVDHEADIGRGAAHVECDEVDAAGARGLSDGADHARRGPAEQRGDRRLAHGDRGQPAAIGLHDAEMTSEAGFRQGGFEAVEIAVDHRLDIGRQGGGGGALVFTEFTGDGIRTCDS